MAVVLMLVVADLSEWNVARESRGLEIVRKKGSVRCAYRGLRSGGQMCYSRIHPQRKPSMTVRAAAFDLDSNFLEVDVQPSHHSAGDADAVLLALFPHAGNTASTTTPSHDNGLHFGCKHPRHIGHQLRCNRVGRSIQSYQRCRKVGLKLRDERTIRLFRLMRYEVGSRPGKGMRGSVSLELNRRAVIDVPATLLVIHGGEEVVKSAHALAEIGVSSHS